MNSNHEFFMRQAIELAIQSKESGNEPFGALLIKNDEIVMTAKNSINSNCDPTHHAEIGLIRRYCNENNIFSLKEYTLYTSCEPCVMCSGAMVWANLGKLVYSVSHEQLAEIAGRNIMISCKEVFEKSPNQPEVIEMVLNDEGLKVFMNYKFME